MQREFAADFRFWSSEKELQYELQEMKFVVFGVEEMGPSSSDAMCIVVGLVLRPVENTQGASTYGDIDHFERVGWLRYNTGVTMGSYVPAGTRTKFILV
jgi:hypothetical protein